MTTKFGLIADITQQLEQPKKKYQQFQIQIGFEKLTALVPFDDSDYFCEAVKTKQPQSREILSSICAKHRGWLE